MKQCLYLYQQSKNPQNVCQGWFKESRQAQPRKICWGSYVRYTTGVVKDVRVVYIRMAYAMLFDTDDHHTTMDSSTCFYAPAASLVVLVSTTSGWLF